MRILLLGGTTEASALARLLAADGGFQPTLSLAGRTASPILPPLACRIGGFGGAEGLARWLRRERVEAVIDATHPYAARISANAVAACREARAPLASLIRAPWKNETGDAWFTAANMEDAVTALGDAPRRVFLTVGRLKLRAFKAAPQHHYVVRAIDPPDAGDVPTGAEVFLARGPFDENAELRLLREHAIQILATKNSGGAATYGKIAAARRLGLPVVMIARPEKPAGVVVRDAAAALDWLRAIKSAHIGPPSDRGV